MLTEKDYCDYDTCVALKELGFPQDYIFARYANVDKWVDYTSHKKGDLIVSEDRFAFTVESESIVAPLLYEAQKFLREEKKIIVNIDIDYNWYYGIYFSEGNIYPPQFSEGEYGSYEKALLEGIKEAVKILKGE